jgi:hypothetical protein
MNHALSSQYHINLSGMEETSILLKENYMILRVTVVSKILPLVNKFWASNTNPDCSVALRFDFTANYGFTNGEAESIEHIHFPHRITAILPAFS